MGRANYMIVAQGPAKWGLLHDGDLQSDYATKEAAFEAAVAATLAVRQGHEVHVSVPSREAGNGTALGAADNE